MCAAEICTRMRAFPFGTTGIAEADHVDAFGQHVARDVLRELGVAQHDRADGMRARHDVEAGRRHAGRGNSACWLPAGRAARWLLSSRPSTAIDAATIGGASELENRYGRERWRSISTISLRPVVKPPDAPPIALPSVDVMMSILSHDAVELGRAAAGLADEAGGVRVVHHDQRVVFFREVADVLQLRDVAVHAEHAVGGDHAHAKLLRLLQTLLEVVHVAVA